MAGAQTLQGRAARRLARPVLTRQRHRHLAVPAGDTGDQHPKFPSDYDPIVVVAQGRTQSGARFSDVLVTVINEDSSSVESVVAALNERVEATSASWLLVLDATHGADERDGAVEALLDEATVDRDVVFADEPGPRPMVPILKPPSVGPHTLLSYNVIGRPALLRVDTLKRIGGFHASVGWAFEHDAYLRMQEAGATFHHVARVINAGRPTSSFDAEHIDPGTRAATEAALTRRGWHGTVENGAVPGVARWRLAPTVPSPSIDIIIPTRDRIDLVRRCVESIERCSTYSNYNIIILDNDSREPATHDYFATTRYRVVACPGAFNYAKIVNHGVNQSGADFVVTLNNDTVVLSADWLEQMVALASLDDVGVVGACLIDGRGQHEHDGFVIAPYPQHLRVGVNYPVTDQFVSSIRDVSAVTGAVQMVERRWWQRLHGMDEGLKVVMNDVDLCLRSQLEGRLVVYTPDVQLVHEAGSTRGDLDPIDDRNRFIRRWDIFGSFRDPYFAESLQLIGNRFLYRAR